MAYVNKSDIYKLFDEINGVIRLHIADVDMLPTADVMEVNHSKWNECHTNESNEKYCDSCGCDFNLYFHNRSMFRFCPYCGAMMHNEWIKHEDVVDDDHGERRDT